MAYCSNCGNKLLKDSKFCTQCGVPVPYDQVNSQRREEYQGKVLKCPVCGEILKTFDLICPSCGHELNGRDRVKSVELFSKQLAEIEAGRKTKSAFTEFTEFFNISKPDNTDEKILTHIQTFVIPNTVEDIFEFMILASSSINQKVSNAKKYSDACAKDMEEFEQIKARNAAWLVKVEQAYKKAELLFGTDTEFDKIKKIYQDTTGKHNDQKKADENLTFYDRHKPLCIIGGIVLFMVIYKLLFMP